jgi:quinohemoprotein amine dehydrogenase
VGLSLRATTAVDGFAVYDTVDYVKVRPEDGMARLGGVKIPKQFVQFEAVAFHRGPDGEPLTDDDIELGPVEASWLLEEYHIRQDDDDLKYVGSIDQNGLFTPNIEGPNPERGGTNNFGDVWAVASYLPPEASRPLKGRARLLVTVPLYAYWDLFP